MSILDDMQSELRSIVRRCRSAAVAFSGGSDSALVAKVARDELKELAVAVTLTSPLYPASELEHASKLARDIDIEHVVLEFDPILLMEFASNPPDRCYICKLRGYGEIMREAKTRGLRHVLDGTNADDRGDYRPGSRAKDELGVRSPLAEARIGKADVRRISEVLGLGGHIRPSGACLASRIPYGDRITREALSRIERAEDFLKGKGFTSVRVRAHGHVARIEVDRASLDDFLDPTVNASIVDRLKELGFVYVALDLEGYRTGSLNEVLRS